MSRIRLACPNCGALYEIAASAIPPEGRDVQCSNCQNIWHQSAPALTAPPAASPPPPVAQPQISQPQISQPQISQPVAPSQPQAPQPQAPQPQVQAPAAATPASVQQAEARPELVSPPASEPEAETPFLQQALPDGWHLAPDPYGRPIPTPPAGDAPPQRMHIQSQMPQPSSASGQGAPETTARSLDPGVAAVLNAEREREASLRAAEASGFAAPAPELMPSTESAQARRQDEAQKIQARLHGLEEPPSAIPPAPPSTSDAALSRGHRLPSVDSLNQSFDAALEEPEVVAATPVPPLPGQDRHKRGFARGFYLTTLVVVLAATLSVSSRDLGRMMPGLAPALGQYDALWAQGQSWLENRAAPLRQALDSLTGSEEAS